jgi:hypothetical protein
MAALVADAVRKVASMWKSESLNWFLMIWGLATPESVRPEPNMAPVSKFVMVADGIL